MKDEKRLQRDVLDELQWEPSIDAAEIGISVRGEVVTLTGSVPTYVEKMAAERVTKRVQGVQAVANEIIVRPVDRSERDDTDIAEAAVCSLEWKSSVPHERVKITVNNGWVTLEGEVDWYFQKEAAEEAIQPLLGVRGVTNLIAVKPRASATDIKSRIEAAFRRSAEIDARKIRVETHEGTVTLQGDVRSWAERREAERTAWAAPGVSHVEDMIIVSPQG
jgi:osmotically-inducible protein OsmY